MDYDSIISKANKIAVKAQNAKANAQVLTDLGTVTEGNICLDGINFSVSGANFDAIITAKETELTTANGVINGEIDQLADDIKAELV